MYFVEFDMILNNILSMKELTLLAVINTAYVYAFCFNFSAFTTFLYCVEISLFQSKPILFVY